MRGSLFTNPFDTFGVEGGPDLWSEPFDCCNPTDAGVWQVDEDGSVTGYFTGQPPCCGDFGPFEMHFLDGNGGSARPITLTENLEPFLTPGTVFVATRHYVFDIGFPDGSHQEILASRSGGYFNVAPTGDVTYTYTPIPEPSTGLLVGLGLTMIAGISNRRKSSLVRL